MNRHRGVALFSLSSFSSPWTCSNGVSSGGACAAGGVVHVADGDDHGVLQDAEPEWSRQELNTAFSLNQIVATCFRRVFFKLKIIIHPSMYANCPSMYGCMDGCMDVCMYVCMICCRK